MVVVLVLGVLVVVRNQFDLSQPFGREHTLAGQPVSLVLSLIGVGLVSRSVAPTREGT